MVLALKRDCGSEVDIVSLRQRSGRDGLAAGTCTETRPGRPATVGLRGGDGFEGTVGDLPDGVWLERGIGPEEVGCGDEFLGVGREG